MDEVTRWAVGCGTLCFGIVAVAVGIRVYQSDTLASVIVGGGVIVAILAAAALVLALVIRLYHVRRDEIEQRLMRGRTLQALGRDAGASGGGPAIDPAVIAALLDDRGGGRESTEVWREVERPRLGGEA